MSSASGYSDLTRRARIRDAALELFADRGFGKTTVKMIADVAEVSPALVIHHFGSKDQLRSHCDEHIIQKLLDERPSPSGNASPDLIRELLGRAGVSSPLFNYLGRMLTEPGEAADQLFARLLANTRQQLAAGRAEGSVKPASDPEVTALLITAFGLMQFLMRERYSQVLGVDPQSPEGMARLVIPTLELLTEGLYNDPSLLTAAREAMGG